MSSDEFVPYVPAEKNIAEVTVQSIVLGIILGLLMTAANCYLGLKVGMTVSASIPAAVMSMAILRGVLRRGTILENNIVQTMTSSGESLAAGIIFTVPALVIIGVWDEFKFLETTAIALLGGLLGVLFMIPMRRALIVKEKQLAFPEGVACAEVLKAGETGGIGIAYIFIGIFAGAMFKLLANLFGYVKGAFETAWHGTGNTVYYFGSEISPLLMSVGYIVGLNVASLVFLGGVIAWIIAIPIISSAQAVSDASAMDIAWEVWDTKIRYLGVGAMVVGGLWTIISIRKAIADSIKTTLSSIGNGASATIKRTEKDLGIGFIWKSCLIIFIATAVLYIYFTHNIALGIFSTVIMVIASFFFVAVASYIVGLVGSSNSPVSGMTICALLFASILLIAAGMKGEAGMLAALGIAGVVCCATCTAGDISQDLKTGYLVGATPRLQQITQCIGVMVPAFAIAPILFLLKNSYGFERTTEGVEYLAAPQANLFANLTRMIFERKGLPWDMLIAGAVIGIILIVLDEILKMSKAKVRTYVMAVAVGIYLPLSMSVPIFIGGLIHLLVWRRKVGLGYRSVFESIQRGILLGSGLIAGEALVGIGLAIPLILGATLPLTTIALSETMVWALTIVVIAIIVLGFISICLAGRQRQE